MRVKYRTTPAKAWQDELKYAALDGKHTAQEIAIGADPSVKKVVNEVASVMWAVYSSDLILIGSFMTGYKDECERINREAESVRPKHAGSDSGHHDGSPAN